MSRYGQLKSGPDGRVTEGDMACWRDLVAQARKAAAVTPGTPVPALERVTKAAKNACAPGVVTRTNACVQLVVLCRRYLGETRAGRTDLAPMLDEAAGKAEALLDAHGRGGRAERKDIDG